MKQSKTPLWRKSCLKNLTLLEITDYLWEITDNGDMYGYDSDEDGYYQEYKPLFDDLSDMAYRLYDTLNERCDSGGGLSDVWDDMTVGLLGNTQTVLGYDTAEQDYFSMVNGCEEDWAVDEAKKRIMRYTKAELVDCFQRVLGTLLAFYDVKTAHDCLTAVVDELDEKGAILERKNDEINRLYEDMTGENGRKLDDVINSISPKSRIWIE